MDCDFGDMQNWQWGPEELAAAHAFAQHGGSSRTSSSTAGAGIGSLHKHVRRNVDLASQYEESKAVTTLMLRSMPRNFTRRKLFSLLDDNGFMDKYDFLYLPLDSGTHCSVGYAFVNFDDPESASTFKTTMY